MNVTTWSPLDLIPLSTSLRWLSNSPRDVAAAAIAPTSSMITCLPSSGSGTSPAALDQALDHGGRAHPGLADQHRVVLAQPGQHLDDAADIRIPADYRVKLALAAFSE